MFAGLVFLAASASAAALSAAALSAAAFSAAALSAAFVFVGCDLIRGCLVGCCFFRCGFVGRFFCRCCGDLFRCRHGTSLSFPVWAQSLGPGRKSGLTYFFFVFLVTWP
jgi:hypothetical protein